MTMPPPAFPRGVKMVPVPAPLLGPGLAAVQSLAELKVILRVLWYIDQKRGVPRPVPVRDLLSDRTLAEVLGLTGAALEEAVRRALSEAERHGTFFVLHREDDELVFLNSESEWQGAQRRFGDTTISDPGTAQSQRDSFVWEPPLDKPTVFEVYEQNIGALTPIIGEQIGEAIQEYPESWIREAIEIAVERNARNWKYIAAILRRWHDEGKGHGESRGDPAEARREAYWRSYGKYLSRG